jgi:hypothetical protein
LRFCALRANHHFAQRAILSRRISAATASNPHYKKLSRYSSVVDRAFPLALRRSIFSAGSILRLAPDLFARRGESPFTEGVRHVSDVNGVGNTHGLERVAG